MDVHDLAVAPGDPLITYNRCWDARTFVVRARLSPAERHCLQRIFEQLATLGIIALPNVEDVAEAAPGLDLMLDHLRRTLGDLAVNAAVGAIAHPATPLNRPQTLIPLWEFGAIGGSANALVAHGLLFGGNLEVHAIPVEDDDAVPTDAMETLWRSISESTSARGTVRLPGGIGPYVVLATVQAS